MTDQLRALAVAKAQIAFPVPELHMLKEIRKERRIGYVEGFIAGRTSVTREQIAAALAEPGAMGAQNHDLRQADRVLALLRGEVAGDEKGKQNGTFGPKTQAMLQAAAQEYEKRRKASTLGLAVRDLFGEVAR